MSEPANPAWVWIDAAVLRAVHEEQLVEHGGAPGVRDIGLFESALARPRHLVMYGEPDLAALAAAYGYALARGHCFPDGNKRAALAIMDVFLRTNGLHLTANEFDAVDTVQSLAAGDLGEDQLAEWIAANSAALS